MNERKLRFELRANADPFTLMDRFHPGGELVLNRTEWRGKAPRTCGVTKAKSKPHNAGSDKPWVFDIEVSYRPPGCITYTSGTRYDGWTTTLLDRMADGTLLDGAGKPLPPGKPPVYRRFEVYKDVDFNAIDFGTFIEEVEVPGIERISLDDVFKEFGQSGRFESMVDGSFVVPRRSRPRKHIMLSKLPTGTLRTQHGENILNINGDEPHIQDVVMRHIKELLAEFLEGRISLPAIVGGNGDIFVELSDCIIDSTRDRNADEARPNILDEYTPESFLEELAKETAATFLVEAKIVEGPKTGLLLRRERSKAG
jgi:hypothetical protein